MAQKQKLKKYLIMILTAVFSLLTFCGILNFKIQYKKAYDVKPLTIKRLKLADKNKAKKLMIVAHPDDELIWGGGHLMDGDYLVVCVTRGYDKVRAKEFKNVVEASGNEPLILSYPDKVAGKRDEWDRVYSKITNDLSLAMHYKDWELIVTQNKKGEYGHIQHKLTHNIVTEIYDKNDIASDLYFFGKYYRKVRLPEVEENLTKISDERLEFKNQLAPYYESQEWVLENLWHMAPYEMWQNYNGGSDYAET